MLYVAAIILALVIVTLLLRLRLKVELSSDRRLVALQLGRTGPVLDFKAKQGELRLFNLKISTFSLSKEGNTAKPKEKQKPKAEKPKKPGRKRDWKEAIKLVPNVLHALGSYSLGILKSATIEQLEAEIEAGFSEPHLTGQTYGYYQAALAAMPGVVGRIAYTPDWTGGSFSASARVAVALPLYKLVFRTVILLKDLPLRKLIRLAIGTKEGASDG